MLLRPLIKITFLAIFSLLSLCASISAAKPIDNNPTQSLEEEQLRRDFVDLKPLIEESLVWRLEAREMFTNLETKVENDLPLSHAEIDLIHKGSNQYLAMRQKILTFAHKYKKYVANTNQINLAPGEGTKVTLEQDLYFNDFYTNFRIDPEDEEGHLILERIKLSLAASLILYDNYLVAIYPYQQNSKLRKLINFDNLKAAGELEKITLNYLSLTYRGMMCKAVKFYEQYSFWKQKKEGRTKPEESYLDILISGSLSYNDIRKNNVFTITAAMGKNISQAFQDNVNQFGRASMNIVSSLFGNTVGLIETRKGKMKELPKRELEKLTNRLKPLDILLEKTPFRLTDKFIPGYYGHVAIWIGTPEDWLKEGLNLLDNPNVKKNLTLIQQNRTVVEALRQGVRLNTFSHFMNIDDLVVLRHKELDRGKRKEYLLRALAQVGKKYDFNFDVETDRKIVCSELAYVVFHDIDWQTQKSVGRFTISPDNVAQMALADGPLKIIDLYHEGRHIAGNQTQYFATLLTKD